MYVPLHLYVSLLSFMLLLYSGQAAIRKMALSFCKEIKECLEWNCSFYVLGPDGVIGAEISQVSVHIGRDEFGHSFGLAHPHHKADSEVMTSFTNFAKSVFKSPESYAKFILNSKKGKIWPLLETLTEVPELKQVPASTASFNLAAVHAMGNASHNGISSMTPLFSELINAPGISNNMDLTLDNIFPRGVRATL